jgi:hypothetical protein
MKSREKKIVLPMGEEEEKPSAGLKDALNLTRRAAKGTQATRLLK